MNGVELVLLPAAVLAGNFVHGFNLPNLVGGTTLDLLVVVRAAHAQLTHRVNVRVMPDDVVLCHRWSLGPRSRPYLTDAVWLVGFTSIM